MKQFAAARNGAGSMRRAHLAAVCGIILASAATSLILVPDRGGLLGAGLAMIMTTIAVVDARRFIIPNELSAVALVLGLIHSVVVESDEMMLALAIAALRAGVAALALLCLRMIYRRVRGREGIGLGDVKLAAVAGAWLDWTTIPIAFEIAAVAAIIVYLVRYYPLRQPLDATTRLPFGLFLAPSIWVCWLLEASMLLYSGTSWFDAVLPLAHRSMMG